MDKIAVVTDSTATIPDRLVRELNIHIVPVWLHWRGQTFRDGVDITPSQVYSRLREDKHLPTTSSPSVGDFLQLYARLRGRVEGILSIHLPPTLSGVYNSALMASRSFEDMPIRVMDCRTAAMGQGFVVLEAARAAAKGAGLAEVVRRAREIASRVDVLAALDTLEYLYRGGHVPVVAALIGSLIKINPILYIKDGDVKVLEKPRTKSRAVQRMMEVMRERVGSKLVHVAVMQADALEEAKRLRAEIASRFNCAELFITEFTPVMGAHTGPGLIGLAFWSEGEV